MEKTRSLEEIEAKIWYPSKPIGMAVATSPCPCLALGNRLGAESRDVRSDQVPPAPAKAEPEPEPEPAWQDIHQAVINCNETSSGNA